MDAFVSALDDIIRDCMRLRMTMRTASDEPFRVLLTSHYEVERVKNNLDELGDELLVAANKALDEPKKLNPPTKTLSLPSHVYVDGAGDASPYSESSFD